MILAVPTEKAPMPEIIEELPRPHITSNHVNMFNSDRISRQFAADKENLRKWGYLLFFVNSFILVVTSALIIIITNLETYWNYYDPFLQIYIQSPGLTLIVMSCILISATLFGYYIAIAKKYYLWFAISLVAIIILEARFVIAGFLYLDNAANHVEESLTYAMHSYGNNSYLKISVDILQMTLKCCGVNGHDDWFDTQTNYTPSSCCPVASREKLQCTFQDLMDNNIYETPCLYKLQEVPQLGIDVVFSILGILVLLEVIMILLLRIMAILSQKIRR